MINMYAHHLVTHVLYSVLTDTNTVTPSVNSLSCHTPAPAGRDLTGCGPCSAHRCLARDSDAGLIAACYL